MNRDEELEAAQARMDERERLMDEADTVYKTGSAYAVAWYEGLTEEERALFRATIDEMARRLTEAMNAVRDAFVILGRQLVDGLAPAFAALNITAADLEKRAYDTGRRRLYWDNLKVERVGRYRPYRSRMWLKSNRR